jgi:hypothetical protein
MFDMMIMLAGRIRCDPFGLRPFATAWTRSSMTHFADHLDAEGTRSLLVPVSQQTTSSARKFLVWLTTLGQTQSRASLGSKTPSDMVGLTGFEAATT